MSEKDEDVSEDVWLLPLDARTPNVQDWGRTIWGLTTICLSTATLLLGFLLLALVDWSTYQNDRFSILYYTLASLFLELTCLMITALGMALLAAVLGRDGLQHALSFVSIVNELIIGACHFVCAVWGGLLIYDRLVRAKNIDEPFRLFKPPLESKYTIRSVEWEGLPLTVYLLSTFATFTIYAASNLPGIYGILLFAFNNVRKKFSGTPIVAFYTQYNRGDEFYVRVMPVDDYADYISHMDNPVSAPRPSPLV